jgi:hypothetical protein
MAANLAVKRKLGFVDSIQFAEFLTAFEVIYGNEVITVKHTNGKIA